MRIQALAVIVIAALFTQGCNVINPAEPTPTFIRLDSFIVKTDDYNKTGTTSSRITSAWVYVDNSLVGVFDVPSTIPVIMDKKSTLSFAPGINYSGLKAYQSLYPFYTFDTFVVAASPGKVIQHTAIARYNEAAKFNWIENFETGNTFIKVNDYKTEDTTLVRTAEAGKVFEGGGSGYIYLTPGHPTSENINNKDIPIKQGDAYIEINYKCNALFEVGLQTTKSGQIYYEYIAGARVNESWNKLYIGLQSFLGTYNATSCRVMIKSKLPEGMNDAYVLIDNIKVISY